MDQTVEKYLQKVSAALAASPETTEDLIERVLEPEIQETKSQISEQVGMLPNEETAEEYVRKCISRLVEQLPRTLYRHLEVSQATDSFSVDQFIDGLVELARRHGAVTTEKDESDLREHFDPFLTILI